MTKRHKPSSPEEARRKLAEKAEAEGRMSEARMLYGAIERDRKDKADRDWHRTAMAETVALERTRGETIVEFEVKRGEADKPMRRKSGLDWLLSKGRIEPHQLSAGLKYGDDYRACTDISLRSCCADSFGGDGLIQMERREEAFKRLTRARTIGLSGNPTMIFLVDQVCGEGTRLREISGSDALSNKKEGILGVALDLLAAFYGITNAWRSESSTLSA